MTGDAAKPEGDARQDASLAAERDNIDSLDASDSSPLMRRSATGIFSRRMAERTRRVSFLSGNARRKTPSMPASAQSRAKADG